MQVPRFGLTNPKIIIERENKPVEIGDRFRIVGREIPEFQPDPAIQDFIDETVKKLAAFRADLPEIPGFRIVEDMDPPMDFQRFPGEEIGAITFRFRYEKVEEGDRG